MVQPTWSLWYFFTQFHWIPRPVLTEKNLPDQSEKVFIITDGHKYAGFELTKILYSKNGIIYVAGRSRRRALRAIDRIMAAHPDSTGHIEFLGIDLGNLASIKQAAETFLSKEQRLDVLWHNSSVMYTPVGSKSVQGHEYQMCHNCIAPFLFTKLLTPILQRTAATSPPGSVRVTWAASVAVDAISPEGGVILEESGDPVLFDLNDIDFAQSKAGNVLLGSEFALRHQRDGIVSAESTAELESWKSQKRSFATPQLDCKKV